jgi:DNA polymerase/3'-5' exonuclease PolX
MTKEKTGPKMTLPYAKAVADKLATMLEPHCLRFDIAGSIRRESELVSDIEIVCQPKKVFIQTDLFGAGHWKVSPEFESSLDNITLQVVKGEVEGRYQQRILKGNIKLDLFLPDPDDYYRQLAIRTGSADYSAKVLASSWVKKGWVGTINGGLRQTRYCIETRSGWKCANLNSPKPPIWQTEEEFFEWLGLSWKEPKLRTI